MPREPGGVLSPRVSYERLCRAKALVGRAVGISARRRPPGDPLTACLSRSGIDIDSGSLP